MSAAYTIASAIKAMGKLVTALLNGGKIHLYTNNMQPGENSELTDFTEADFVGYPSGGLTVATWPAAYWLPDDDLVHVTSVHQFQPTDGTMPQIIYGYFITDVDGLLLYAESLPVPFNLVDENTALLLESDIAMRVTIE
jgi:hypothetical protein